MIHRFESDLKEAMRSRDSLRVGVLRMAVAAMKNEAVAKGLGPQGQLAESDALAVVKKLVKSREEAAQAFRKGGAEEKAQQELAEIEILRPFLPRMLEGADLENAVRAAIQATGAATRKDAGAVMKHLMAAHPGLVDGKAAQTLLQSLLS